MGESFDVCIVYPGLSPNGNKQCYAVVKLTSDDLQRDDWYNGCICTEAAYNKEASKDEHTEKVNKMVKDYWMPRWKHTVFYLRRRMADDFDKFGDVKHHEPLIDDARAAGAGAGNASGAADDGTIIEVPMPVFAGCTGKIIGTQGAKIKEIKAATHVAEINMPAKVEGPDRPRGRAFVDVGLKGTLTQINAAKVMIQEVMDEWVSFSFV